MAPSRTWLLALHLAAGLAVLGCQGLARPASPAAGPEESRVSLEGSDVRSVLEYYRRLDALSESDLQREFSRAQQEASGRRPVDQIRLAVLLGLPRAPFKDYDRSLALLTDAAGSAAQDAVLKDFLLWFSSLVQELKRQGEQYQKLDLKFKEEKKQRELLQQKLDELATIEKQLLERDRPKNP
ncbi:MAG: hypothetical protein AB1515_09215 [Nitrospirota bacterium]